MQFYIDSADLGEIRQAHLRGWVDGVTTNPSLVAKVRAAASSGVPAEPGGGGSSSSKKSASSASVRVGGARDKVTRVKNVGVGGASASGTGSSASVTGAGVGASSTSTSTSFGYRGDAKVFHDTLIQNICKEVRPGLVSAEVLSLKADDMVREGCELHQLADNVVVKIPMTEEGLVAVRELTRQGIKTNVTLVFSVVQAVMAAKAGATLVSPFVGRIDDTGADGMQLIEHIVKCYNNYKWSTRVLVASVRSPLHVARAAVLGADVVTLPFKVMQSLTQHPLTTKGLQTFLKDAGRV